jgi:hypothetical protein
MSGTRKNPTVADLTRSETIPRPPRLKPIWTKEDIDSIPYFDEEERQLAVQKLLRSIRKYGNQATITVATGIHDPKGAMATAHYGDVLGDLVIDGKPETRHVIGGTLLNLLVITVMKHCGDESLLGSLARGGAGLAKGYEVEGFKRHHLMLMDFPNSEVWSREQRLMLLYARAVLDGTMTDELWQDAVRTWGVKMCLRYIQFTGYFWSACVRNRVLKVPYLLSRDA